MKQALFLIVLLLGKFTYADGLDEMRIYVNQKLVATSYEGASQVLELEVSIGDPLNFEIWTDWGGMEQSSFSAFEYQSSEKISITWKMKRSLRSETKQKSFEFPLKRSFQ